MSNTALKWEGHDPITLGYIWYTAPAARGFYIINPTFTRPSEFNKTGFVGYHVAPKGRRLEPLYLRRGWARWRDGIGGSKVTAQADHDAGRDR